LNQAIELDKILKKHQIDIDKIIEIDVEEEILIQRITTRALETNNSRDDDNSNVLKNRIEIYKKDTKPVLNFYSNMDKLITINGMLSIDEVSEEILNSL
jgi:adenylate kinase